MIHLNYRQMLRAIFLIGILLFLGAMRTGNAQPFNEIIAFGDSLTDVGNVAGVTELGVAPRINGYYKETHFSDNILWIEWLANYWNLLPRTPGRGNSTTLPPRSKGNTWAWGGSEAAAGSVQPEFA
jgi:phospholipase/lecithinase/hemolysin